MFAKLAAILISAFAVWLTSQVMNSVSIKDAKTAILVAVVLAILNAFVKPILEFLSIPITILTLGLFLLVINAGIIMMCSYMIEAFKVKGFWSAMLFSIVLWLINGALNAILL